MPTFSDELIVKLSKLGFSKYEAKTYLGLLKKNPATGYEISQNAHVPRSVIYSTLRKMETLGYVISIHEKPSRFIPLSPKQLLAKLESDFTSDLTQLGDDLIAFDDKAETEGFWNIRGYRSLIEVCNVNIKESKKSICISGWKSEIDELEDALTIAKKNGVDIVIFSFNKIKEQLGQVFSYGIDESKLTNIWDHKLIMVTDNKDLVMGPANKDSDEQAIWTQNKAVLKIALNYIVLDLTLYGQRMKLNVSDTVVKLMPDRIDNLDEMLKELEK